jgi:LysM repeat protein
MKISRNIVFLIAILLVVGLAACTRSIPGAQEEATPTTGASVSAPLTPGATDIMQQIYLFATQTAQAQEGQPPAGLPEAQETPSAETPSASEGAPPPAETEPPQAPAESPPAQPTAPVVDVPPPTPGLPTSYTLEGGEFPYCIARRFNVNPGELLRLNGLNSYSVFYTGMTLKIPQTGRTFPGNRSLRPHPASYTVRAGDTIYKIACAYGDVSPDAVVAANGLAKPYNLSPGQVLNIP